MSFLFNIRVTSKEELEEKLQLMGNRIRAIWDEGHPLSLNFSEWKEARSRSQNNLYWQWCGDIADDLTARGSHAKVDKDDVHDMLRYKFLGVETLEVPGLAKTRRLPSTTKLSKGAMAEYMGKVEAWAYDLGILLPTPADNDYKSYREASQ